MKRLSPLSRRDFWRTIAVIDLLVFLGAALVCWTFDWRTLAAYGRALQWGALLAAVIGAYSVVGSWGLIRTYSYQQGSSVGPTEIADRTQESVEAGASGFRFFLVMLAAALPPFLLGAVLETYL